MFCTKQQRGPKARVIGFKIEQNVRSARSTRASTGTATAATGTTALGTWTGAEHRLRLHRQQPFALQLLAGELARTAHGFGLFTGLLLGWLFVMTAELHLAENTLALHLLLQRLKGLVDIVIANENLHAASSSIDRIGILRKRRADERPCPQPQGRGCIRSNPKCPSRKPLVLRHSARIRDLFAKYLRSTN